MSESNFAPFESARPNEPPVRGYLHTPARPSHDALILTHGAGSNCTAPLLVALADAFCESGVAVLRCDLPFRQLRPHGPPPPGSADRDQQGLRAAIEALKRQFPAHRVFLGGHSYGGRQASILAASNPALASALLLRTPALFVHGARDGFATLDELTAALKLIPARTQLLPIEAAGHELLTARNRPTLPQQIASTFSSFVATKRTSS
jgi:hypothetical protein